jgi:hypothetical protein
MSKIKKIEIVVSRFNEDLKWTTTGIFNNYKYIVYNKGDNDNFEKSNVDKIIELKNVGKCDHTYLYHIITNYNNLSDITLFLPGSLDLIQKREKATELLDKIKKMNNAVFLGEYYKNIKNKFEKFCLDNWISSNRQNFYKNNETALQLSEIRPFGQWYKDNFADEIVNYVCYWGIFSIDKRDIIQHPISRYTKLLNQLSTSSNPEVGHYIERSWNAIFHPMINTNILLSKY